MRSRQDVVTEVCRDQRDEERAFEAIAGEGDLLGLLSYSLHDQFVQDWKVAFEQAQGRPPTREEVAVFNLGECTPRRVLSYRRLAEAQIADRRRAMHPSARNAFIQLVLLKAAQRPGPRRHFQAVWRKISAGAHALVRGRKLRASQQLFS